MERTTYCIMAALILWSVQFFSPLPGEGAAPADFVKKDPFPTMTVMIEVDGKAVAYAAAIKGVGDENEVLEMKSAGDPLIRKIPGRLKISDIVIKKYATPVANDFLYQWRRSIVGGGGMESKLTSFRKNGAIVFLDGSMKEVARYNFYNAWPSQWKGMGMDVQSPLPEEIVLTVERIERIR